MNRRQFLTTACAAPAFLHGQSRRPNILFLLADDQRWDALGCMGDPIVKTPNIDSLASMGVTFTRSFVTTSMIVHDPRLPIGQRNRRAGQMTLNIDLAPALLDIVGVQKPAGMQGKSLAPAIAGRAGKLRDEFFYEHHFTSNGWIPSTEGIRLDRWKYTIYTDEPSTTEELYDLEVDMWEETNLAGSANSRQRLEHYRGRRQAWLRQLNMWRQDQPWTDPA